MSRRWSPSSRLFAALAVVAGLAAFGLVNGYVRRVEALAPALGGPVRVAVAEMDLPRGTVLAPGMLREETFPSTFAPPGALSDGGQAVGRTLLSDLAAGEPLTVTRLGREGSGPIASLVPEGLRAVPVHTSLPPGAIHPGDRVDVLATYAGGQPHTETVASGLEVLLVLGGGHQEVALDLPEAGLGTGPLLVLLVSPELAERLAYARAFADVSVTVAGPPDGGEVIGT